MQVWELAPGRLMVAGGFSDLALHHHPAVQVTVGGRGPLTVTCDGENDDMGRLAVPAYRPPISPARVSTRSAMTARRTRKSCGPAESRWR
jgi:hypothetical protein